MPASDIATAVAQVASVIGSEDSDTALFAMWFTRLGRLNESMLETVASTHGLTSAETVVLAVLLFAGPPHVVSPTALQHLVIQSPGGVTKTLRRLEEAGLVRRRTDASDRRALLVELTARGKRAADKAFKASVAYYDRLLVGFDRAERAVLLRFARRLLDELEPATGARSSALLFETKAGPVLLRPGSHPRRR